MSELRERFDALADAWEAHCEAHRAASNPFVYVKHDAFDAIVAMGADALPLIIERYRTGSVFWAAALARITGKTEFGNGVTGKLEQARAQWLAWWDAQHPAPATAG